MVIVRTGVSYDGSNIMRWPGEAYSFYFLEFLSVFLSCYCIEYPKIKPRSKTRTKICSTHIGRPEVHSDVMRKSLAPSGAALYTLPSLLIRRAAQYINYNYVTELFFLKKRTRPIFSQYGPLGSLIRYTFYHTL